MRLYVDVIQCGKWQSLAMVNVYNVPDLIRVYHDDQCDFTHLSNQAS
jgi:hypothetical protein